LPRAPDLLVEVCGGELLKGRFGGLTIGDLLFLLLADLG